MAISISAISASLEKWPEKLCAIVAGEHPVPDPVTILDISDIPLASGSLGSVHHCKRKESAGGGAESVLKILDSRAYKSADDEMSALITEVSALSAVQPHPNIVKLHAVHWLRTGINENHDLQFHWAMELEFCNGGDLHGAAIRRHFSEAQARDIICGVLGALAFLHEKMLVHRDVKPENVLVAADGIYKLTDFGLVASLLDSTEMKKKCGTPGYIAPEVWLSRQYGVKVDTFSAGCLLYFVLSGKMLFAGSSMAAVRRRTLNNQVDFSRSKRLQFLSTHGKDFFTSSLQKQSEDRPTASFALRSAWIACSESPCKNGSAESPRKQALSRGNTNYSISEKSTECQSEPTEHSFDPVSSLPSYDRDSLLESPPEDQSGKWIDDFTPTCTEEEPPNASCTEISATSTQVPIRPRSSSRGMSVLAKFRHLKFFGKK